jgi:hypothetical protein
MKFLLEYKSYKEKYKENDIVLIEYWYKDIITPVKIIKVISNTSFEISHNVPNSEIKNAPDQIIKANDIIDLAR